MCGFIVVRVFTDPRVYRLGQVTSSNGWVPIDNLSDFCLKSKAVKQVQRFVKFKKRYDRLLLKNVLTLKFGQNTIEVCSK